MDSPKSRRRILCVEDYHATCEMLVMLINLQGHEVTIARTAAEGLSLAKSEHFDLLLLDNWLPDGSGIDLCQQIREFDRETPVVFYSLWDSEADRQRGLEAGAQAYLGKLRNSDVLIKTITRLIEESAVKRTGEKTGELLVKN